MSWFSSRYDCNEEIAALPPCSPAKGSRRRVLWGYVSSLLQKATRIPKKIKTIPGASQKVSPSVINVTIPMRGPVTPPWSEENVRFALHQCVDDALPPLSKEEFEKLYSLILDNELAGWEKLDSGKLIGKFLEERKL